MQKISSNETIIDIHRHIAHPSLMANLAAFPREVFLENIPDQQDAKEDTTHFQRSVFNDIDAQVQAQNQAGITKGLLGNAFLLADVKPHVGKVAQDVAAALNDNLAGFVARYPNKLDFLATVHPFEPGYEKEIERSLTRLGAKGLTLDSSYAGRWLDDPVLEPFWAHVQSRDIAVSLHPPINPLWLPGNDTFRMQELLYRPFDVITSSARMICSGLFDRYPQLKVVIPFGGAGLLNLLGRLEYFYQIGFIGAQGKNAVTCQRPPSSYMRTNLYIDLSLSFSPSTIRQAIEICGTERVLFGSDYPAALTIEEQIADVKQLDLRAEEKEQILWKNSNELFHLDVQGHASALQSN
ncbi:hypothetical protein EPA93_04310 [Ktedonosporobacter rubrisoli]|uniref:6-methylsalicylate decarboxylase n=1 Tax=Ktedonosporobacter rubrisoli TaxID=2509675 RepID=A0A4P6JJI1_KTERU|nr:amidohydrolase family protein [Ktedonosporobacter rubrisoli]QBD75259.1 hypothetical protein EPA93_04310 [Ktedonosporobacter rubrisoli]